MIVEPCNICGNTEVNLVDGFYYCVECGTQDVNVQETVVDKVVLASGVFAQSTSRKFNTVLAEGMEMSGEWYKWHAYNFILVGLANELISLGAPPSFKIKALWIWTRYINKIQVKDNVSSLGFDDEQNNGNDKEEKEKLQIKNKKIGKKIVNVTRCLLLTILYLALNFDGSEMQLSHLLRYMREGRLSLVDCIKFVPKEIKTKSIPNWMGFVLGTESPKEVTIRRMSMEVIKVLNLGLPKVPDIRKLVDNYVLELCMPDDFKNLVYSLLHFMPYDDWLEMNEDIKKSAATLPHYEAVAMAYVVLALKMCFGLDDVYELRLSDATDQINDNEMHMKSYKLGSHSQPSDRLFSFREWCKYLQFRKITLAKNYLPLAMDFSREVDDYALMEQSREYRPIRPILLSDDVAMNILNNIPEDKFSNIVSLEEFPPSVTPISTYTKAVLNNTDDPDIRLLLSEDFSQYSIKYVCENLKIPHDFNDVENIVVGVDEINKIVNNTITGTMTGTHGDVCSLVYVKNCDNKNWLISKPPTSDQVADINETENNDGNDSDNGYSSNIDNTPEKRNSDTGNSILENMKEYETNIDTIIEEPEEKSIFDDDFTGNDIEDSKIVEDENSQGLFESQNNQSINYVIPSDRDTNSSIGCRFDPDTFNRELTIRELVLAACKEYKIPVPKEYKPPKEPKEPRKRRSELIKFESEQDQEERPKRRKKEYTAKQEIEKILSAYYSNLQNDVIYQVSEQVKSFMNYDDVLNNTTISNEDNTSIKAEPPDQPNMEIPLLADSIQPVEDSIVQDENINDITDNDVSDLFPKIDPRFDEKTHDIKQLYINIKQIDDFIEDFSNDPDIDKIITNKLREFEKTGKFAKQPVEPDEQIEDKDSTVATKYHSDSEDELPLKLLHEDNLLRLKRKRLRTEQFHTLVKDSVLEKFRFWIRHYSRDSHVAKHDGMTNKFDRELDENFPKSFKFLIDECASIISCTAFTIYKNLVTLEQMLVSKSRLGQTVNL